MSQVLIIQEQGVAGPRGDTGPQGPAGPPGGSGGGSGGGTFVFPQLSPSAEWTVTHNLNFFPAVTVVDSAGTVVEGDIQYLDANTVLLSFTAPFAGSAYLS